MRGIVPVALTPFTPDETRAQRGTAVLVFRSRRCARAVEGSRPGIWKMRLEGGHDVGVVHDLLTHEDRRVVLVQRPLDGLHGPVNAGTVTSRFREQHATTGGSRHPSIVGREPVAIRPVSTHG